MVAVMVHVFVVGEVGEFEMGKSVVVVFFFFQAEDGIRDGHVTGVQTCALPISSISRFPGFAVGGRGQYGQARNARALSVGCRSEERRVGKECRSRWSLYH